VTAVGLADGQLYIPSPRREKKRRPSVLYRTEGTFLNHFPSVNVSLHTITRLSNSGY
jgi:hypothetical protein